LLSVQYGSSNSNSYSNSNSNSNSYSYKNQGDNHRQRRHRHPPTTARIIAFSFAATLLYILLADVRHWHRHLPAIGRQQQTEDSSSSSSSSSSSLTTSSDSDATVSHWDDDIFDRWESFLLTEHPWTVDLQASAAAKASLVASDQSLKPSSETTKSNSLSSLLYFNESRAFSLLNAEQEDDFFRYQSGWEAQITQSLCAVATTAALLNSLRDSQSSSSSSSSSQFTLPEDPVYVPFPWATQSNILDVDDKHHGSCVEVALGGRSNAQAVRHIGLGVGTLPGFANCFLHPNGYHAEGYHAGEGAEESSYESFLKQRVIAALEDHHSRVLLNYDRGGIGQGPMGHGHWSPLGAYNEETDSFLVMDVAKYKHPMVWVSWEHLWGGVATKDTCSTMTAPPTGVAPPDFSKSFKEIAAATQNICHGGNRGFVVVGPIDRVA